MTGHHNYKSQRTSCDEFTKKKEDQETDSKRKLNYKGNLLEYVKENIKLLNRKRKGNSRLLTRDRSSKRKSGSSCNYFN